MELIDVHASTLISIENIIYTSFYHFQSVFYHYSIII